MNPCDHRSGMKYETAIRHWKTPRALADTLGISVQAVQQWKDRGLVPLMSANRLQQLSKGKCKVEFDAYPPRRNSRV